MLGFVLFNMLFNDTKSNSKGSKFIPLPPKWLIEESIKRQKKQKKKELKKELKCNGTQLTGFVIVPKGFFDK
jgi:hypothetical protein